MSCDWFFLLFSRVFCGFRSYHRQDGYTIFGTRRFIEATNLALDQLQDNGIAELISGSLDTIRQGLRSTGYIRNPPCETYVVGAFTWHMPPSGYAGAIAYHAHRRHVYRKRGAQGRAMELECAGFEASVMRELRAPEEVIKLAMGLAFTESCGVLYETENGQSTDRDHERIGGRSTVWAAEPGIRIRICGPDDFVEHITEALTLIQTLPKHRGVICDNIREIYATRRSTEVSMSLRRPRVSIGWEDWRLEAPTDLAGVLAHEAYHNVIFRKAVANRWIKWRWLVRKETMGVQAERACCEFEAEVLEELGEDSSLARLQAVFPTHGGDPGSNFWDRFN